MTLKGFAILPDNGEEPDTLVWLMHGCGGTGREFAERVVPELKKIFTKAAFYAPDGKLPSIDGGYQHFEIESHYTRELFDKFPDEWSDEEKMRMKSLREGVDLNADETNRHIDTLLSHHNLNDKNVIMIGYSQGAQSVLHAAFRRQNTIQVVVGLFGSLLSPDTLAQEARSKPPAILVASESDNVLPPKSSRLASEMIAAAQGHVQLEMLDNADHHQDWPKAFTDTVIPALATMTSYSSPKRECV